MATPSYARSLSASVKRLKLTPYTPAIQCQTRQISRSAASLRAVPMNDQLPSDPEALERELSALRLPKAVQATYLNPLKRQPTHHILCADLQLRSYSVRNLELFADFAMRAAYYLHLPATGPKILERITERWTVPRSSFIFKKSQENFERKTLRRKIQIYDGSPQTVGIWLAFLKKYQYYGVGMKANVWESSGLDVAEDMDKEAAAIEEKLGEKFELFGGIKSLVQDEKDLEKRLLDEPFKAQWGSSAASVAAQSAPHANQRIERITVHTEGRRGS